MPLGYGPFMEWERTHRRLEEAERRGTRRKVRTRQGRRDARRGGSRPGPRLL